MTEDAHLVRVIRTPAGLARAFDVSNVQISNIVRGVQWNPEEWPND